MGDRFDRRRSRDGLGRRLMLTRGKPPPTIIAWGLGAPASLGHNNGPPLDEEPPGYSFRRYRWNKVHAAAWKTPSMGVLKFRVARAEAAGLSYRDYMLTLLDTGRFAQARDRDQRRIAALASIRAAFTDVIARAAPASTRMQRAIVLASVTAAYDDPARAYHDVVHLAAVLQAIERHRTPTTAVDTVQLAALFHDIIYDARRDDNEAASARVAQLHLGDLGCDAARLATIAAMILATRHRPDDVAGADADTALLLDCDLAILAAPVQDYVAYAAAVRREYAHVLDEPFRAGRTRVLTAFLARPRLYATDALMALWEDRARANLRAEIRALGLGDAATTTA